MIDETKTFDEKESLERENLEKMLKTEEYKISDLEGSHFKLNWRLELYEKIGEGGLGEVYRGHIAGGAGNFEVAVKFPKRGKNSLDNLRKEAHISAQLKHDDIGKTIIYEETEKGGMIIMDYIKGKDLSEIVNRHKKLGLRIPQKFSAFIGWVCCEALKYAHRARVRDEEGKEVIGVLHRDISPGNIIINSNGYPKLLDFGIGILTSDLEDPKISSQIAGKLGFIAPEILEPEIIKGKNIDQKVDIYSLGMLMDYLVRGKNPLLESINEKSGKLEALTEIKKSLKKGIEPLEEDVEGINEEFAKIIKKATKINRKERYSYAENMKEDLRKYLFDKGYGPDRDRLKLYIDLVYTPGIIKYLEDIKNNETYIQIPMDLKNKLEKAKELMPYMVRKQKSSGEEKLYLETLKDSGYKTEDPGYLPLI